MNLNFHPSSKSSIQVGLVLSLAATMMPTYGQNQIKPNILWITIEDTSPEFIGFYGNRHVKTPNIDRLANEGVIFNHAFASGPVCSASRSCLITGVNNGQLGTGNHRSQYPLPYYMKGFPSYLRSAGYYTSNNFKTDYNTSNDKAIIAASWDESSDKAGWWNKTKEQNFFSVFNYEDCHQSRTMTNPWSWYEERVLRKLTGNDITTQEEIEVPPIYRDTPEMRKYLSRVYNSINLMDIRVGKLLDSLKRDGLMESTIIFFYADHGEAIPRGKSSSVALSYRVPFFIWFPEKFKYLSPWKTGQANDELFSFEDLPPTILSLAGVEIPKYMTGRALLGKERKKPQPFVYGCRNRIDESPDLVRTATDGRFFYTREFFPRYPSLVYQKYADVSDIVRTMRKDYSEGKLNKEQSIMLGRREVEYLYDLKSDPWELNNLAKDSKMSNHLKKLRKVAYERLIWNNDLHFLPEYEINKISEKSTPYEFGKANSYHAKEVIDAAYEATNPVTKPEKLYEMLNNENQFIRYWGIVGIYNKLQKEQLDQAKLSSAMKDTYTPVAIQAAAILWDNFMDDQAKELLKKMVMDRNLFLSLQSLQMIEYLDHVPEDMLSVVQLLSDKRNNSLDGYQYDYTINSCCDLILYKHKGSPLFVRELKSWTDPKYLQGKK